MSTCQTDVELPEGLQIENPREVLQAVLNLCRDAKVSTKHGCAGHPSIRCNVQGLTLGHWLRIFQALGQEVCEEIVRLKLGESNDNSK